MNVNKIEQINFDTLMKVLSSYNITEIEKNNFVNKYKPEIKQIMEAKISSMDYKTLMQKRGLKKFRPLKNSFTKKGDKILLAKALNINPSQVSDYVKNVSSSIQEIDNIDFLSPEKIELLKIYVYRHGTKDELVSFLDLELTKSKDLTKSLYHTLSYYSGGIADYFIRPIHRMDNGTLLKIFKIINKHIEKSISEGKLTDANAKSIAKWALIRIYQIQNNSKLINALKTYKMLK